MRQFILALLSTLSLSAHAQSLITNGDFELGKAKWTASAGSFGVVGSGVNLLSGFYTGYWDASAASQTLSSVATTVPVGLQGRSCAARFIYKGGDSNLKAQVFDGTNVLVETTLTARTTAKDVELFFTCPSSGSVRFRLISSADAAMIYLDDVKLGVNDTPTVSQAVHVGSLRYAGTGSCQWFGAIGTSYANASAVAACPTPTLTGDAQSLSKIPGITFASLPPGRYQVVANGRPNIGGGTNALCSFQISDGTTAGGYSSVYNNSTVDMAAPLGLNAMFDYTSTKNNVTFQMQAARLNGTGNCFLYNSIAGEAFTMDVYRYPTAGEQPLRVGSEFWKVDANVGGANPQLSTATVSTFTEVTASGLTLVNNSGTGNIAATIPCSGTNPSTGLTCSAGTGVAGVQFTPLGNFPQDVEACVDFADQQITQAGGTIYDTFQIAETGNSSNTITQAGYGARPVGTSSANLNITHPVRLCQKMTFTSGGTKTLRLFYQTATTATVGAHQIPADNNLGGQNIRWTVRPMVGAGPSVILPNQIFSGATNSMRVESALLTCGSTPAYSNASSSWISSVTYGGAAGRCVVNFAAGTFSATPNCTASNYGGGANYAKIRNTGSATAIEVWQYTAPSTPVDNDGVMLICMGPR